LSTSSAITDNGNFTINRSNSVSQGTDFSGSAISGTGSFTQAGSGTTTLSAANTYTGATTISGGKLVVNGSLGATALSVNSGASLAGTGTIGTTGGGSVSVASGGTIDLVDGYTGTLSIQSTASTNSFTLAGGSTLNFEISSGVTNDKIALL